MCDTCGCGEPGAGFTINKPGEKSQQTEHEHQHTHHHEHGHHHGDEEHAHAHGHTHSHSHHHHGAKHDHAAHEHHANDEAHAHHHHNADHDHSHDHSREINVQQDILGKNNLLAERNRGYFEAKNILALNLVSSPGSGKTSLVEKMIKDLGDEIDFYVIEGDQQTMNDANRIMEAGAPVVQVNTGNGCHLDAEMVNQAVKELDVKDNSILIIENVGNLVCPSLFDLGESHRVVVMSTTEGEDKPIKYPTMFESSDVCVINKTDLLPYVDFDVDKAMEYARRVNHHLTTFRMSVKNGEGTDRFYEWLKDKIKQ